MHIFFLYALCTMHYALCEFYNMKGDFNANRSNQFASRENSREEGGTH